MDFSRERSVVYLRAAAQALYDENQRLKARVAELEARQGDEAVSEENTVLKELLERAKEREFGRSSERRGNTGDKSQQERELQTGHGPREQPNLELKPVEYELPESERVCPCCGCERMPFGAYEEAELITVTLRAFERQLARKLKYRCACENSPITTAPGPTRVKPGGRYSLLFAIEVVLGKYCDHLPLERQVRIMKREGLIIDVQTLWDQIEALATHVAATYEAIITEILKQPVIGCDETRWELLDNGKMKENKRYQAWGLVAPELVAYRILDSRGKEAARSVLSGYTGTVMADCYTVYKSLAAEAGAFKLAHCWTHVRRKFIECEKNAPEEAGVALTAIRAMYAIEKKATAENLAELREKETRPIVEALFKWAKETLEKVVLQRSGIAEALRYLVNHEAGLKKFLDDPLIPIDNNASERAVRSVVLGRKNHYGSRSLRGTKVAAIFYTLMESARLSGVDPRAYLLAVAEAAIRTPGAVLLPADFKAQLAKQSASTGATAPT